MIKVKLIEIDKKTGKYRLSRKVLMEKPEGYVERAPKPPGSGGGPSRRPAPRSENAGN